MNFDSLFGLNGRVVLVTGASSGIGLHAARLFSDAGATVALAARRLERTEELASALRAQGRRAVAVRMDVTDTATIAPAFDTIEQELQAPVDVLLNNAGLIYAKRFLDQEQADVDRLFDTNLRGAFRVAQVAARRMAAHGQGVIINVASTAALRAAGMLSSYAASKAALLRLSEVMALELASKGIRVNTLCPGNIETDMQAPLAQFEEALIARTPMRRFGKVQDLDGALLLLASDAGRYMTGAMVTVDGGQALSWM
ncbi:SDR family oxidoreductase [Pseudomonas aeruginosa]|nr:SDR family oxidoreductase [Pseudomonas aeruginosa]